jgi:hypothetical protein
MTPIRSNFKTMTRAAVIAMVLGTGALTAAPAFAQSEPSFNFSITVPGGGGSDGGVTTFGRGHGGGGGDYGFRCLTNREVRRGISEYGFRRVEIVRELRRDRVEVVGQYRNRLYSMRVDKCTGEVDRVERIRRGDGGGFGLHFNFGN